MSIDLQKVLSRYKVNGELSEEKVMETLPTQVAYDLISVLKELNQINDAFDLVSNLNRNRPTIMKRHFEGLLEGTCVEETMKETPYPKRAIHA